MLWQSHGHHFLNVQIKVGEWDDVYVSVCVCVRQRPVGERDLTGAKPMNPASMSTKSNCCSHIFGEIFN